MCLMSIVYVMVAFVLFVLIAGHIFGSLYATDRRPDAVHFVETEDGWQLALHRYDPPKGVKKKRPVLCCHGLSGNHFSYDLTERTSIARMPGPISSRPVTC